MQASALKQVHMPQTDPFVDAKAAKAMPITSIPITPTVTRGGRLLNRDHAHNVVRWEARLPPRSPAPTVGGCLLPFMATSSTRERDLARRAPDHAAAGAEHSMTPLSGRSARPRLNRSEQPVYAAGRALSAEQRLQFTEVHVATQDAFADKMQCMSRSQTKLLRRLEKAQHDRSPAVIRFVDPRTHDLVGVVIEVARKWIAVHRLDEGFFLDEVVLVRVRDVHRVAKPHNHQFVRQVLDGIDAPLQEFEFESGVTTRELLQRVADRSELVCVYIQEPQGHTWRQVGIVRAVGNKRLEFHAIGDDGKWLEDSGLRRVKRITRVELGGRYLETFQRFGQGRPAPSTQAAERVADLVRDRQSPA